MDPLGRLRDLGRKGLLGQVTLGKEVVDFGDGQTFPRDEPTAFRSSSSNSLYLLESVVFAVLNEGLAFGKLRKKAKDEGVKTLLTVVDTSELLPYIKGQTDSSKRLDYNAPELRAYAPQPAAPAAKEAGAEAGIEDVLAAGGDVMDRNKVLLCPSKNFDKVLGILKTVEEQNLLREKELAKAGVRELRDKPNLIARSNRFESEGKEAYYKNQGLGGLGGINEYGGVKRKAPEPASAPAPSRQPQAPRSSSKSKPTSKSKPRPSSSREKLRPIILVPAGYDTLVNMYNVNAFLKDGKFKTWEECRDGEEKRTKSSAVGIIHGGREFKVQDQVPNKGHKDWDRVVAVFANGKQWQFKGYPHDSLVETFSKIRGFHLRYSTDDIPEFVKTYAITVLSLDKNNRYKDASVSGDFWAALERHLASRGFTR